MSKMSTTGGRKRRKSVKKELQAKSANRRGKTGKAERKQKAASRKRSKVSEGGFLSGRRSPARSKATNLLGKSKNRKTKKGRVKVSSRK